MFARDWDADEFTLVFFELIFELLPLIVKNWLNPSVTPVFKLWSLLDNILRLLIADTTRFELFWELFWVNFLLRHIYILRCNERSKYQFKSYYYYYYYLQ